MRVKPWFDLRYDGSSLLDNLVADHCRLWMDHRQEVGFIPIVQSRPDLAVQHARSGNPFGPKLTALQEKQSQLDCS